MLLRVSRLSTAILCLSQHVVVANLYIERMYTFQVWLDAERTSNFPSIQRVGGIKKDCKCECVSLADPGS